MKNAKLPSLESILEKKMPVEVDPQYPDLDDRKYQNRCRFRVGPYVGEKTLHAPTKRLAERMTHLFDSAENGKSPDLAEYLQGLQLCILR